MGHWALGKASTNLKVWARLRQPKGMGMGQGFANLKVWARLRQPKGMGIGTKE
ncbi:hypothetical protein [Microcoleus sp. FACHB-68]|uniref:hypothetical protein n=1 Tax=Microcoleus sp. FACHB-68 TaxID=2692826 RepID=UPI001683C226|nr:hypothetical protein [Microcoleus sp. FACHB-68]MBD1940475.1 hypothetical protein [Microcoleus sp. FACHB-68]